MKNAFLTAEWRKLIMAQYVVDPASLKPYLPAGLELDLSDGQCFVSLVGFLFDHVRVKGIPIPFHTRFEEVNLRFYVRRSEAGGAVKRGVVFISEIVPRMAITLVANTLYEEPYRTLGMRHRMEHEGKVLRVVYDWRHRGAWSSLGVEASAQAVAIAPGSTEEFITEHYWGYTKRTRGATSEYPVEHPRWMVYPVQRYRIDADFGSLYGARFAELSAREPDHVLLAEGSAVSVGHGSRLTSE